MESQPLAPPRRASRSGSRLRAGWIRRLSDKEYARFVEVYGFDLRGLAVAGRSRLLDLRRPTPQYDAVVFRNAGPTARWRNSHRSLADNRPRLDGVWWAFRMPSVARRLRPPTPGVRSIGKTSAVRRMDGEDHETHILIEDKNRPKENPMRALFSRLATRQFRRVSRRIKLIR